MNDGAPLVSLDVRAHPGHAWVRRSGSDWMCGQSIGLAIEQGEEQMRVQATFRSRIGRLTSGLVLPLIAAAIAGLAMSHTTLAQSAYPVKSIKLIVGFAPGGPTDILARVIGKGMA